MIANVLRLTVWEWHKLRRRRITWLLLAIAIVIAQLCLWSLYIAYQTDFLGEANQLTQSYAPKDGEEGGGSEFSVTMSCADMREGRIPSEVNELPESQRQEVLADFERFFTEDCAQLEEARETLRKNFTLPGSIGGILSIVQSVAVILTIVLAASTLGSEYGWGTLRTVLVRGVGRWQYLASKTIALMLMVVAGLLIMCLTVAVGSLVTTLLVANANDGLGATIELSEWTVTAAMFGKTLYGLAPYLIAALFLGVLTSSTYASISIALVYYVGELVIVPMLSTLFDWFRNVKQYVLGPSIQNWLDNPPLIQIGASSGSDLQNPDVLQAFLVLLAYIIIFGAATFWLFQRRDITGAKGQ